MRYLRLLQLAATYGEDRVATALGVLLRSGKLPCADGLELQLRAPVAVTVTALAVFTPELASYDTLLTEVAS
jgi:hypothetical protein